MAAGISKSPSPKPSGRPGAPSGVTIGGQQFANGVDVSLYPNSAFPDQRIDAVGVFAGYGIEAPDQRLEGLSGGLDVRGKIVAVFARGGSTRRRAERTWRLSSLDQKAGDGGAAWCRRPGLSIDTVMSFVRGFPLVGPRA